VALKKFNVEEKHFVLRKTQWRGAAYVIRWKIDISTPSWVA